MNPVKEILAKLDALEGRNPELATDERVSRRAELAARQEGIESGDHAPDVADNIRKLAELRDAEVLSDEEFEAKKRDLLDRM